VNISSIVSTIIMKLSTVAILLGAAVAAVVPGVVSAEVSSCVLMRSWSEDASRESLCCLGAAGSCVGSGCHHYGLNVLNHLRALHTLFCRHGVGWG
jgi:hypothetical protein